MQLGRGQKSQTQRSHSHSHGCPNCDTVWPEPHVAGIGQDAVKCDACGNAVKPFEIVHGYTVTFDDTRSLGLTLPQAAAEDIATKADHYAALPDSHNAGDFGAFLVGAPHAYGITPEQLAEHKTDGHMDIDAVRAGAILVAPVKVKGAGVYMGDMHAGQGDGEIAGHTMDVSGSVTLQVEVVKNYPLDGPVLFPLVEDLPPLAKPFSAPEMAKGQRLAEKRGVTQIEALAPISVIGTAANLNDAIQNGLERAAKLLGVSVAEIRNRATVNGAIEIGRAPGVIQVTFLAPLAKLDAVGLGDYAREQYGL